MLLGDFLGEKVGSFQEEFRETTLKTGILGDRGEVFSERRDDQALCPSKDSLTRTSSGWGFRAYYSGAISHELQDSRSCISVLAGAKRLATQSPVWMRGMLTMR